MLIKVNVNFLFRLQRYNKKCTYARNHDKFLQKKNFLFYYQGEIRPLCWHKKTKGRPMGDPSLVVSTSPYSLISPSVQWITWILESCAQYSLNFTLFLFHCPFVPVYFTEVKEEQ